MLKIYLERAGHQVRLAGTLRMAETLLATHQPALIVTDLTLPDGRGRVILEQLRHCCGNQVPIQAIPEDSKPFIKKSFPTSV